MAVVDSVANEEVPTIDNPPEAPKKVRKTLKGTDYTDVSVVIGLSGPNGTHQEIVHQIDGAFGSGVSIVKVEHGVEEKVRQCKEDGQLVGFEPTGEYVLTLKVKYIKD
jgi:hypothetical protein